MVYGHDVALSRFFSFKARGGGEGVYAWKPRVHARLNFWYETSASCTEQKREVDWARTREYHREA